MLTGQKLGYAIKRAIELKKASGAIKTKVEIANHFGVKPPSVVDWEKKGSIAKDKLPELWRYFSDVVGPDHWGMADWPQTASVKPQTASLLQPPSDARINNLRKLVSQHRSAAAFSRATGIDASYVSQLMNGHRSFGEKAARNIEEQVGLIPFSLDSLEEPYPSPSDRPSTVTTTRKIPLLQKQEIGTTTSFENSPNAGEFASAIASLKKTSSETFAYIEDTNSMPGAAPVGSVVLIDPSLSIDLTEPARIYLFRVNDKLFLGELQGTPIGLQLRFLNNEPGWEPITVTEDSFIGGFIGSFSNPGGLIIR